MRSKCFVFQTTSEITRGLVVTRQALWVGYNRNWNCNQPKGATQQQKSSRMSCAQVSKTLHKRPNTKKQSTSVSLFQNVTESFFICFFCSFCPKAAALLAQCQGAKNSSWEGEFDLETDRPILSVFGSLVAPLSLVMFSKSSSVNTASLYAHRAGPAKKTMIR